MLLYRMTDESFKNEEDDLFYFESDHLALKGNIEYSDLMKTLFVLEAQRRRAIDVSTYQSSFKINSIIFFHRTIIR